MEMAKEQKMTIPAGTDPATPSFVESVPSTCRATRLSYLVHYFTSRDGWVGDYVYNKFSLE